MNDSTNTYGHTYPELEKQIQEKDTELKREARREGKFLGMQNRPGLSESSLEPYFGFIKTGYEGLRAQIFQIIQPDVHEAKMKANCSAMEQKQAEIAVKIIRLTHENTVAKHELDGKVPDVRHGRNLNGWLVLGAIYLGELVFNAWSFEFMGDSLLFSLLIALGVSVGMYLFSRGIMSLISRFQGMKMYLSVIGLALPALALILVISTWRANMLNASGEESMNPAVFAVVNIFLFIASMLASYFFFPKKEEQDADRKLRGQFEAIEKRTNEIAKLSAEKDKLETDAREQALKHQQIMSLANHAAERIDTLYHETAEIFKSTLLAHRDDRMMPVCFSYPVPELKSLPTITH
ncbi:MAG: hypothetical protein ABIQ40_18680 [Bacteroidia bacterium]